MSQAAERQQRKTFLRISEKQRTPLLHRVNGVLHRAGLQGFEEQEQQQPRSVEVPRSFGIGRGFHRGETARVAHAISQLGEQTGQGTDLYGHNWVIEAVRVDGKGREKKRKLPRWPFGWESRVQRAHRKEVRRARRESRRVLGGTDPMRQALRRENQEAQTLRSADKTAVVTGWFSKRAEIVALLAEGNPIRIAKRFLRVGQSRADTYGQLHTMMLQVADAQLDPADRIHGPFEEGVKLLQRFQRGVGGALLTSVAGDLPILNSLIDSMVTVNKAASRDARAELTLRGILRVLRRVGVINWYGDFYGRRARKPGVRGFVNRLLLFPPDALAEQATDRRMQRGNVAKLAKTEAILAGQFAPDSLEAMHQRVVAEEFVAAYNAPAPTIEMLTDLGYGKINDAAGQVESAGRKVASRVERLLPQPLRRKKQEKPAEDPREAMKAAVEAYGDKPMSVAEQVQAILDHADAVLASQLTPIERARWTIARDYARRFDALSTAAHGLIDPKE